MVQNGGIMNRSPLEHCPYCLRVGRGAVTFIPAKIGRGQDEAVIWLCKNWRICPFPNIDGPEAVRRQTVPRHLVDSSLLGNYSEDTTIEPVGSVNILDLDNDNEKGAGASVEYTALSPSPALRSQSPSVGSYYTNSSDGQDFVALPNVGLSSSRSQSHTPILHQSVTTAVLSIPKSTVVASAKNPPPRSTAVSGALQSLMAARRGNTTSQMERNTTISTDIPTSSQSDATAASVPRPSRKRPLVGNQGDQGSFPGYGRENGPSTSAATPQADPTAALLSMVAKKMRAVRRNL